MITNFWKEHFDHILLVILAVLGAGAGLWADAHGHPKASDWLFTQSAGTVAALLMRMQGHRSPNAEAPASNGATIAVNGNLQP